MRFYTHVITNVFTTKNTYQLLMGDILMYGYTQEGNQQMIFTSQEKSRVNKIIQFQEHFAKLKQEILDMQVYSESGMEDSPLMNLILSLSEDHASIDIHKSLE